MGRNVVGGVGAFTGIAIAAWSWRYTTLTQEALRRKVTELLLRILNTQMFLSLQGSFQCPLCAGNITLADEVRFCLCKLHCFHADCYTFFNLSRKHELDTCPCCESCMYLHTVTMIDSLEVLGAEVAQKEDLGSAD